MMICSVCGSKTTGQHLCFDHWKEWRDSIPDKFKEMVDHVNPEVNMSMWIDEQEKTFKIIKL